MASERERPGEERGEAGAAAERLQEAEARLVQGMRAAKATFFDWDLERGRMWHDPRLFGWECVPEIIEGDPRAVFRVLSAEEDVPGLLAMLEPVLEGATDLVEVEHRRPPAGGRSAWVRARGEVAERDAAGRPRRIVGVVSDVTESKALRDRVSRVERLASMGTLVAGMLHEINNPLACVKASLAFAQEEVARLPGAGLDVAEALADGLAAADALRDVVGRLRAFSTGADPEEGRADLASVVRRALGVARPSLAACASVRSEVPALPPVRGGEPELVQVVAGLLANAGQATGERPNHVAVDAAVGGGRALVRVSDTGTGIPPEILPRIFDPFFTTRGRAGRGLGLSVCQGIVGSLGGSLTVESRPGQGTTVVVDLPLAPIQRG